MPDRAFWDAIFSSHGLGSMMEDYLRSEIKNYMKHGKATALFENDSYEAIENFRILQTDYRRQRVMARDIEKRLRKTKGDDEKGAI